MKKVPVAATSETQGSQTATSDRKQSLMSSTETATMPTSGSARRRAKAIARRERVTEIVHKIEDREFYDTGAIPASATSVSICSCGARSFSRADDFGQEMRDFDDAHAYCGDEVSA